MGPPPLHLDPLPPPPPLNPTAPGCGPACPAPPCGAPAPWMAGSLRAALIRPPEGEMGGTTPSAGRRARSRAGGLSRVEGIRGRQGGPGKGSGCAQGGGGMSGVSRARGRPAVPLTRDATRRLACQGGPPSRPSAAERRCVRAACRVRCAAGPCLPSRAAAATPRSTRTTLAPTRAPTLPAAAAAASAAASARTGHTSRSPPPPPSSLGCQRCAWR